MNARDSSICFKLLTKFRFFYLAQNRLKTGVRLGFEQACNLSGQDWYRQVGK